VTLCLEQNQLLLTTPPAQDECLQTLQTMTPLFQSHPIMFSIESAFPHLQFDSTTLLLHMTLPFLDTFTFGNTEN
jgi:hypothetical protein